MDKIIFLASLLFFLTFPSIVNAQVVLNEIMTKPTSGNDWIELYSDTDVDISGWTIIDSTSQVAEIPPGTTIGPSTSKYYIVEAGTRLNNSGDSVYLINGSSETSDEYSYSSNPGEDVSFGRYPDGQDWKTCAPTKESSNTGCQYIFPSATPTNTPTSSQGIVQVDKAKDQDGNEFDDKDRVKIYIDGTYINHYAPETLTFCDGCFCKSAPCGFGSHNIRLEKSGYEDWSEPFTVNAGDFLKLNPVLRLVSTSGPSASQVSDTSTPTPTGSQFKVSIPLSNKPKPEGEESESDQHDLEVLGAQQVSGGEEPESTPESENKKNKMSPSVILFILAGVIFIGLAVFLFMKQRKQEQKGHGGKKEHTKAD